MLDAVWMVSSRLGADPDRVLDWRESKLMMWVTVADRGLRAELLRDHVLMHVAVWDPRRLTELLGGGKEALTKEQIRDVLERAEALSGSRTKKVSIDEMKGG